MDPFTIVAGIIAVVSGVASYQQAKKMQEKMEDETRGVEANIESNIKSIPVVYGERRVGGVRVFIDTSKDVGNKYLYMVLVMAEGEVEDIYDIEIDGISIDDEKFRTTTPFDNNFWYAKFLGSDTQEASDLIIDGVAYSTAPEVPPEVAAYLSSQTGFENKPWNDNHTLSGVAYLAMKFAWDENAYTGVPDVTAIVKGKKVYNPSTQLTEWSNNPALCIRDYLTNTRYGKGLPESAIDDNAIIQATSDLDGFVVTPFEDADDIKLFELNMVVDTERKVIDNLSDMLLACRGFLPYSDGKYGLRIDQATNHVIDVDENLIIGGISIIGTKKEDRFNQVKVNFFNKDKEFKEDTAVYPDTEDSDDPASLYQVLLAEDGGEQLVDDVDIHGISNYYSAREMAKLFLLRSRLGTAIAFTATSELMELEVGDTFRITHPTPEWVDKKFQVQEIGLNFDGTVKIQAIEYSADIYTYNTASEETPFVTTKLPDPNKLAPVTSASPSVGSYIDTDGRTVPFIDISWTAPNDALVDRYEIKYTIDDEDVIYSAVAIDTTHRIIEAKGSYDIEIYAVNGAGSKSTGVTLSDVVAVADTSAPSDITGISISSALQSISLTWTNPTEDDFDLVRIKVADTNAEPPTHKFEVRSDSFVHDIGAYSTEKHYWLAPVDRTGNFGNYVSGGTATTGSIAIGDVPSVAGTFYLTLDDDGAPTDAEFLAAVNRNPTSGDFVVVNKEFAFTRNGTTWTTVTEFIDGSLLVTGSLSASDITTGTLDANNVTISNLTIGYSSVTGTPTIPSAVSDLTNDTGFITGVSWNEVGSKPTDIVYDGDITDVVRDGDITDVVRQEQLDTNTLIDEDVETKTIPHPVTESSAIEYIISSPTNVREALVELDILDAEGITIPNGVQWSLNGVYQSQLNGADNARVVYKFIVPLVSGDNSIKIWSEAGDGGTVYSVKAYTFASNGGQWFRLSGRANTNAPSDADFNTAFGRYPTPRDVILVADNSGNTASYYYNPTIADWDQSEAIIHGDLLVSESITALGEVTAGTFSLGNGKFSVNSSGQLSATDAIISGNITADSLDVEDATITGTLTAPIGWSNSVYSGVINRGNLSESVKDLIDERIAEVSGGISGDFGQDDGSFNLDSQLDDDPQVSNITHESGKNITIELSGSRSWTRTFIGLPVVDMDVSISIQRSLAGADSWSTIATITDTDTNSSITTSTYTVHSGTQGYSISIYHTIAQDPASGNYDYRAITNDRGLAYNVSIPLQLTVVEPATIGAGNADTLDNQDGTYYLNYNNFTNTPTIITQTDIDNSISALVDSAPATLDTLNELAAALGDDANFAQTTATALGTKWTQDNTKISNWDDAYEAQHSWEWRWQRWSGTVQPPVDSTDAWQTYYETYFAKRTSAIDSTHPFQDGGYLNTIDDVDSTGGFGGSTYGNMFGDLSTYHCLIYTNIYVDKEFTVNITTFNGDDPHAIFVDGKFVHGRIPCCTDTAYSYTFTQGWHRIDLIYSEGGGGDWIRMGWNPKDYTANISDMVAHRGSDNPIYLSDKINAVNNSANWDTAYGWGDHSTQGYITSISTPREITYGNSTISGSNSFRLAGTGIQTRFSLVGYNEQDTEWEWRFTQADDTTPVPVNVMTLTPTSSTSANLSVTGTLSASGYNNTNWDTAHGWGNHASAGYLTSLPSHNHDDRYYTETESDSRFVRANNGVTTNNSNLGLVVSSNMSIDHTGNVISKISSDNNWDGHVYSSIGFTGGCVFKYSPTNTNRRTMVGINSDPTANSSYTSIDYCFYIQVGGSLVIYESGASIGTGRGYAVGDELAIIYDNSNIRYYHNNELIRTVPTTSGRKFHFDSSFYDVYSNYTEYLVFEPYIERNDLSTLSILGNEVINASRNATFNSITGSGGLTLTGGISASGYNNTNWDTAYGWGNHASAGYLTSHQDISGKADLSGATFSGKVEFNDEVIGALKVNDELANTDLDTLSSQESGVYWSNDQYSTNSNIPFTNYFTMLHLRNPYSGLDSAGNSLDRASQLWMGDTPSSIYWRGYQGSTTGWHDWEKIWTDADFSNNSSNWDTAHGWGNHASANYIVGGGTWAGGTGSSYTTLAQSVFATGNTKFTFYGNSGKMDVIADGEFYASEGASRVFHDTYHPNADKWTTARTLSLTGDVTGSVAIDGSANASITATVANDSHTHDGRYYTESESDTRFARVHKGTAVINTGYTTVAKIDGNGLASSIDMTIQGTSGSVVVNVDAKILVNHSQDILIKADSGIYTQLKIKVTSTNNEDYAIELARVGGTGNTSVAIEIFPRNSETVTFVSTHTYTGNSLELQTEAGTKQLGSGGSNYNFRSDGEFYSGSNRVFHDAYHPNSDKWTTARNITLGGDLTGSVSIDGSANVTLSGQVVNDSHSHSNYLPNSGAVTHSGLVSFSGTGSTSGVRFNSTVVANDAFGIRANGTNNAGELEFYSTDDDNEPFVFRHYTTGQDGTGPSVEWARISNLGLGIRGTTVIDSSRNITGASITGSSLTVSGSGQYVAGSIYSDSNWGMIFRAKQASPVNAQYRWANSVDTELMRIDNSGNLDLESGGYRINGTTVIDSSRNATFTNVTSSGSVTVGSNTSASSLIVNDINGAKYQVRTGGYDLKFEKHDSSSGTYATGLEIRGVSATDGFPNVYVNNNLTVENETSVLGTLVVGSDTSRKPIQVKSNTWAEVQFFTAGTEYVRIGSANGGQGTTIGDFFVYDQPTGQMNLIVKRGGLVSARTGYQVNGTTVIDSSRNLVNIASASIGSTLTVEGDATFKGSRLYRQNSSTGDKTNISMSYGSGGADDVLFDSTHYFEDRYTESAVDNESNLTGADSEYTYSSDAPFAGGRVLQTNGYRTFYTDYIPVSGGDILYGEIYQKVISGTNNRNVYYGIERYDSQKRAITGNGGTTYFVAGGTIQSSSSWYKWSNHTTIPTSHTPYNGSDGGAVKYIRIRILLNYSGTSNAISQFGGWMLKRANVRNNVYSPSLFANTLYDYSDNSTFLELEGDSLGMRLQTVNGFFRFGARNSTWCHMETDRSGFYFYKKINVIGTTNATTGYQLNGSTVIDSSRNLTNIKGISASQDNVLIPYVFRKNEYNGYNGAVAKFVSTHGHHSWGINTEFRVDDNNGDRPSILFSHGADTKTWSVGYGGGTSDYFRINRDHGYHNSGWGVAMMTLDRSGNVVFAGNVTAYSDARLKDNVKTLDGSKVYEMRGVSFTKDGELGSGVIAQELEQVAPELVMTNDDEMQTKSVAYGNVVGYLIEAIKELKQEIEELKNGTNSN
jgi:hypothetical protein